jgi:uncharacterized membrane protein
MDGFEKRSMGGLETSDGESRQSATSTAQSGAEPRLILALRITGIVLALSPIVATLSKPMLPATVGEFVYAIFSPICHNKPSRTLQWFAILMPLCSRCFGIFIGFGTAGLFPKPRLGIGASVLYGFVASLLMVADVMTQDLGLHPVWHSLRILTGVVWGHICGLGILAMTRMALTRKFTS